jgi:hypothetical protein
MYDKRFEEMTKQIDELRSEIHRLIAEAQACIDDSRRFRGLTTSRTDKPSVAQYKEGMFYYKEPSLSRLEKIECMFFVIIDDIKALFSGSEKENDHANL